jgi:hypothetical protein
MYTTISAYAFFLATPPWVERLLEMEDQCIPLTLRGLFDALSTRFFCRATLYQRVIFHGRNLKDWLSCFVTD